MGIWLKRIRYESGKFREEYAMEDVEETEECKVGDLCLVPMDLHFPIKGWTTFNHLRTPIGIQEQFIYNQKFFLTSVIGLWEPSLTVICVEDLEGYMSLTDSDFQETKLMTKLFLSNSVRPGFFVIDVITKVYGDYQKIEYKDVNIFQVELRSGDLVYPIPETGVTQEFDKWFDGLNYNNSLNPFDGYVSLGQMKQMLKFPKVGLLGTVLDKRVIDLEEEEFPTSESSGLVYRKSYLSRLMTKRGMGHIDHSGRIHSNKMVAYKILFRDRIPMWIFGDVYRHPGESLSPSICVPSV